MSAVGMSTVDMSEVRVDVWIWSVRLYKTRSAATADCRAGHIRVNGNRAKPAQSVKIGDRVVARTTAGERTVVVRRLITKRVGATVAAECLEDLTPPPPPKEERTVMPRRDPGAGRPTKRDRRQMDRLRGTDAHDSR